METQVGETIETHTQPALMEAMSGEMANRVKPQQSCTSCGSAATTAPAAAPSWIYAIGRIEARFPSLAIEKEYAQVLGRDNTSGLTDKQALHTVLARPENRYLARKVCWVMTIEGLETYLLHPRDSLDLSLLVEAVRESPSPVDLDIVIGSQGPIAPPDACNGLQIPIVVFDQVYSLDRETLVRAIPRPEKVSAEEFAPAASELFDRIMQMADNAGATDEHRALNYLAVRYPAVYSTASAAFTRNASLDSIDVQTSPLSGAEVLLEVVFSFGDGATDVVDECFTRVDVTDEFLFLVSKMAPYFDR